MTSEKKFNVGYDYSTALLISENGETLIGGSSQILKKALKDVENPNINTKGIDVYYRNKNVGTFAVELGNGASETEKVIQYIDKLYTNLLNKNSTGAKVAETKLNLETLFRADHNFSVRVLARTVLQWYAAVTDMYLNGRHRLGLPLPQKERAQLGEQFREEMYAMVGQMFTELKKKRPQHDSTEITNVVICHDMTNVAELLDEYSRFLTQSKVYAVLCESCNTYFLAHSWNAHYCENCKPKRKTLSKKLYAEKCSDGIRKQRQVVKYRFENFIYKSKIWDDLSDAAKTEYQQLRSEYISSTKSMLEQYEYRGEAAMEREIERYIKDMDTKRVELEGMLTKG